MRTAAAEFELINLLEKIDLAEFLLDPDCRRRIRRVLDRMTDGEFEGFCYRYMRLVAGRRPASRL